MSFFFRNFAPVNIFNGKKMKNVFNPVILSVAAMAVCSCSKLGNLTADNFKVTPTPLEMKGGLVEATINTIIPEKYMKKKAVVTVTPVLRYEGGETVAAGQTFQGESVLGNEQTVSYKVGGNYSMRTSFVWNPAMLKSDMYLHFDAKLGKKVVKMPEVKVDYGVLATSDLLARTLKTTAAAVAPDNFQRIIAQKQEANIKFLIAQAQLRQTELKSASVQDFVKMLKEINADRERLALDGIDVSAYASPDGSYKLNEKLAEKRQNVSADYVRKQVKTVGIDANVDTKFTAEDWDGFQQLVAASNIQDKEVILRVLSMYQDPEEREAQIQNMSAVFKELKDGILPELRRARMTINYSVIGRDDDQIIAQFKANAKELSLEEIIYGANLLVETDAERMVWNKKAIELYPNDYRAYNNLAALSYAHGDLTSMENYLNQATKVQAGAPEIATNSALMNLAKGDVEAAMSIIGRGAGADAYNSVLGCINIAKGSYSQAAIALNGVNSNSAALAQILNKDYASAAKTLSAVKNADATTDYLRAIVSARTNDVTGVTANLKKASVDASLADRAKNDLEFKDFNF